MAERLKYFLINKKLDYARGYSMNMEWQDNTIYLLKPEQKGFYFSRVFDSREKERIWHRMSLKLEPIGENSICLTLYTAEEDQILLEDQKFSLQEFLLSSEIQSEKKKEVFLRYKRKEVYSQEEVLLHDCKGRYFWFILEMKGQGKDSPKVREIKIEFPKQSLLRYLPELYQENPQSSSFVERFLLLFDSLYQDMSREIEKVPMYFDPDSTNKEMLLWLAEWLSMDHVYIWREAQLRYLVKHALELYRQRGTANYLRKIIELYTEKTPYIVEYYQYEKYINHSKMRRVLTELYGNNSYIFTVILPFNSITSSREYSVILKIIEKAKPAHMEGKLVVLSPYILLDKYCYLGLNSILGEYENIRLDGSVSISFSSISNSSKENRESLRKEEKQ